jgi:hypothetical protein
MPTPPLDIHLGDIVQMRKSHPCGGDTWRVVRLGAEIGIRCLTCDRKVLLPRSTFERRVKRFVERAPVDIASIPEPPGEEQAGA